jgi:hypothetical protein
MRRIHLRAQIVDTKIRILYSLYNGIARRFARRIYNTFGKN